jgi:hypothetical protein
MKLDVQNFKTFVVEIDRDLNRLDKKILKTGSDLFKNFLLQILSNPLVKNISWTQYTGMYDLGEFCINGNQDYDFSQDLELNALIMQLEAIWPSLAFILKTIFGDAAHVCAKYVDGKVIFDIN